MDEKTELLLDLLIAENRKLKVENSELIEEIAGLMIDLEDCVTEKEHNDKMLEEYKQGYANGLNSQ